MAAEKPLVTLEELGWDEYFSDEFSKLDIEGIVPARVISQHRSLYIVWSERGELTATIAGSLRYRTGSDNLYPVTGDWVAVSPQPGEQKGVIMAVLPRKSSFSRQAPGGRTQPQVVAANIDTVFLVSGLDGGRAMNLRRMERYLTLAWNSGASPVIVLNKSDLCPDIAPRIRDAREVAPGVPVHAISALENYGLDELRGYITGGQTAALLGSSGVGKSAIINALLGRELLQVRAVRESDREGRHTTTRRELILLPGGGTVIDTPGMREIQIRGEEEGLKDTFEDIEEIAGRCRFSDCRHDKEPGCAVRAAIEDGTLDPSRFRNYQKLQRELRHQAAREQYSAGLEEKLRWKRIAQFARQLKKRKR
jgi:ribosome biogenesis GTPase